MGDSNFWNEIPKIHVCWKFGNTSAVTEKTSLLIRRALLLDPWMGWLGEKAPKPRNSPQSFFTMPTCKWQWDVFQFMDGGLWCWWCRWRMCMYVCVCMCAPVCVCVWQVLIQTQASLFCKLSICIIKTLQKPPIFQTLFSVKSDPRKKSKVDRRNSSNICYVPSKILNTVYWWT